MNPRIRRFCLMSSYFNFGHLVSLFVNFKRKTVVLQSTIRLNIDVRACLLSADRKLRRASTIIFIYNVFHRIETL